MFFVLMESRNYGLIPVCSSIRVEGVEINLQVNGCVRKNVRAAKKEDSLPVLGDDNCRGIDPDRFVNIHDCSLENPDCRGFVRNLEGEDIHAIFC
jgi:hypothetical protein